MAMRRKKKYEGELFMIYLAGYGLGRFFFEWFRTDKLYIPGTKVGISLVISAILFAVFMPVSDHTQSDGTEKRILYAGRGKKISG